MKTVPQNHRDAKRALAAKLEANVAKGRNVPLTAPVANGYGHVGMTCGRCKHTGDADKFLTDSFGLDRPRGEIQCPACGWAVHRRLSRDKKQIILEPITPTFDFTTPPQPQPPTIGKTKYEHHEQPQTPPRRASGRRAGDKPAPNGKTNGKPYNVATDGPCPF